MLRQSQNKASRAPTNKAVLMTCGESYTYSLDEILALNVNGNKDSKHLLDDLFKPLFSSATFIEMLETIDEEWSIRLEHISDNDYALDIESKILSIDNSGLMPDALARSVYFRQCIRHNILRGLREVWHIENFQDDYDSFAPDSLLKYERIRSADVECMALLCIYEMHLCEEQSRLWQHLLSSDAGDMAIAFSRFLERGPFTHNKLELALQQAFKQWYSDRNRVDSCDHRTLEEIDNILLWDKHSVTQRCKALTPSKISDITSRQQGQGSYIGDLKIRLMRHPAFSVIADPVNQVHLAHIMRDIESVAKGDVYFRSQSLADKIFPEDITASLKNEDMVIR